MTKVLYASLCITPPRPLLGIDRQNGEYAAHHVQQEPVPQGRVAAGGADTVCSGAIQRIGAVQ